MSLVIETDPTPLITEPSGTVRVAGSRVTLESVIWLHQQGQSAEAIHGAFPSVPIGDVHAVIAYYLKHKDAVDQYLSDSQRLAQANRQRVEAQQGETVAKGELQQR